ncbi:microviridin/marinostatin family tricyclic proteinase inhibitor [Chryseobacterium sp. G0201]|uniref:microviridin/marinostatin family tricyclic proteinase inhibitor n=1 Tax=Chryseobacterium sp. G0201 TaxID=2487065 RepID=UPI000F50D401|nr:microviridin/marinostatin family tricyclic proteinase inhibitor [Chryseobacterium sp. G0201]AZA51632.1 serine endopeptidase [Chryseobacterium sp. G0201]
MKNKNLKKPFFASFLEKQIQDPQTVKGGAITTALQDSPTTSVLRDTVTNRQNDQVTMKYPSDSDETGELD